MDGVLQLLHDVMSSPWVYMLIFTLAMLDGFFPVVPAETAVITAGVFAAGGQPDLVPLVGFAAAGAFVGDHISYALGRLVGRKPARRLNWVRSAIAERGGLILVVARFIPGGRTAVTVSMGALRYPRSRFTPFDAVAALAWALYSALIGYFGGAAFEGDPIRGLLLGLGIALSVTIVVEAVRLVRRRAARRRTLARQWSSSSNNATERAGSK
ncbi:DedA family protein [Asanoa sp. NPDC050611]|uniref:DedA family protein n=1 Tax=Asanoa sp. NPDC050611 TaxID=3157098 RepID=UPI0033D1C78A